MLNFRTNELTPIPSVIDFEGNECRWGTETFTKEDLLLENDPRSAKGSSGITSPQTKLSWRWGLITCVAKVRNFRLTLLLKRLMRRKDRL